MGIKTIFTSSVSALKSLFYNSDDVSVCRHNAVFAAILHKAENKKDEVRICLGWNEKRKEWHAQAKYKKTDGSWIFLRQPPQFTNWATGQDDFKIEQEFSLKDWLAQYLDVIEY